MAATSSLFTKNAMAGQVDACRRLIALGADVNDVDQDGVTPKDYAEMAGEFLTADELDQLMMLFESDRHREAPS